MPGLALVADVAAGILQQMHQMVSLWFQGGCGCGRSSCGPGMLGTVAAMRFIKTLM